MREECRTRHVDPVDAPARFEGKPFEQAIARIVEDPIERRHVLERVAQAWRRTDVDSMVATSPLIEVTIADAA